MRGRQNPIIRMLVSPKYWLWVIFVGLAAGGIYLFASGHWHIKNIGKTGNKPVCSSAILKQAKPNLDPTKAAELSKDVDQITAIPDYQKDANCMYIITSYYVNISDAENSEKNLTVLKQAMKTGIIKNISPILTTDKSSVSYLETSTKVIKNLPAHGDSSFSVDEEGHFAPVGKKQ
jgi:hypothetical protein